MLSKRDLLPAEEVERLLGSWREQHPKRTVLAISAATGAGLEELTHALFRAVDGSAPEDAPAPTAPAFQAEHRVYRPRGDGGYEVVRIEDGVFEVEGRGVEMLVERHDLSNPEAVSYLERRLNEIGVIKALRDAGFEPGDEVRVGEESFELHP